MKYLCHINMERFLFNYQWSVSNHQWTDNNYQWSLCKLVFLEIVLNHLSKLYHCEGFKPLTRLLDKQFQLKNFINLKLIHKTTKGFLMKSLKKYNFVCKTFSFDLHFDSAQCDTQVKLLQGDKQRSSHTIYLNN